jgi:hypothetical protein
MGISERTLFRIASTIVLNAEKHGYSPEHCMTKPLPDHMHLKRLSTCYNKDGEVSQQWVIGQPIKEEMLNMITEAAHDAFSSFTGVAPKIKRATKKKEVDIERLSIYPIGDPHIGMYAWAEESGEDFDVTIARKNLIGAFERMFDRMPVTHTGVLLNLGDFFHADNMENATARSGNALDVDSRWQRVLRLGVDIMIECVHMALLKHEHVVVKNLIGNHDDHTSHFLAIALDLFFKNNPRVEVDTSPKKFWFYRFGKNLIGSAHGDTAKPDKLPGIMAADRPQDWGATEHRYWYTGHVHSMNRKEWPGVVWESFRTLAAKDAWHTSMGYRSGRDLIGIVLDKDHGEVERHTINISALR